MLGWSVLDMARRFWDSRRDQPCDAVIHAYVVLLFAVVANPFVRYNPGIDSVPNRLALLSWILVVVLVPRISQRLWTDDLKSSVVAVLLVVTGTIASTSPVMPVGADYAFLAERQALAAALTANALPSSDRAVVAEHGLQFLISAVTGRNARSEPRPGEKAHELWLVRRGGALGRSALPPDSTSTGPYALVPAETIEPWLARLPEKDAAQLRRLNRQGFVRFLSAP
jgi:hypothetical protein